jgi:vacuolar protein sorting-associated protein 13A/C
VLPARGTAGAADQQARQAEGQQTEAQQEQEQEGPQQQQPAEDEGELQAVHDWSHGTSGGEHTVKLDSLDEGITRLVCCPALGATQAMGSASELEVNDLWFSLAVESDVLAGGKGAKPLTDWRVVVSAPLRLTNQLPMGGSLLVWEQQPGAGRELVGRQTVQVASGATVPIHTADMRRAVSFTFYPEGYEWVEPQPTVLSEGHAGGRGGCGQHGFAAASIVWGCVGTGSLAPAT